MLFDVFDFKGFFSNVLKIGFLFLLEAYKIVLSPVIQMMGFHCKYYPSCSSYAHCAFSHYKPIKALLLTTWRLMRCNPFSMGGFDPLYYPVNQLNGVNKLKSSPKG